MFKYSTAGKNKDVCDIVKSKSQHGAVIAVRIRDI